MRLLYHWPKQCINGLLLDWAKDTVYIWFTKVERKPAVFVNPGYVCWVRMCDTESAATCWLLQITDGNIQCELVRLVSPAQQPKSLPRLSLSLSVHLPIEKNALTRTVAINLWEPLMQNLYSFLLSLPGNCSIHYLGLIYSLRTAQTTNFAKTNVSTGLL